jgi:hypothetical protein
MVSISNPATTSMRALAAAEWKAQSARLIDNRFGVTGTRLSMYDVHVPAFPQSGAVPGVRAWSPPV